MAQASGRSVQNPRDRGPAGALSGFQTGVSEIPSRRRLVEAEKNLASDKFPQKDKITLLKGDALDVLKILVDKKLNYDFIFLDAAKAQYMSFLPELMKLLGEKGMLVTDNVLQDGTVINSRYSITRRDRTIHTRMREYLYTITHMDELSTVILPIGDGIALSNKL